MELKQIEAFVWVAWERSYTRAADAIGITQPAVSARISALEKELGFPLFVHGIRQVQVTSAGETFLRYGEEMLNIAAKAAGVAKDLNPTSSGAPRLRIGANSVAAAEPLPRWIREFTTRADAIAGLTVDVTVERTPALIPLLRAGSLDLAFVSPLMATPASTTILHFTCPLVMVVPPGHELAGRPVGLRELAGRPAVAFVRGPAALQLRRIQRALPTKMNVVARSNAAPFVARMVEEGVGAAVIPEWAITGSLRDGRLLRVNLADYELSRWDLAAVGWRDRPVGGVLRVFVNFLATHAEASDVSSSVDCP